VNTVSMEQLRAILFKDIWTVRINDTCQGRSKNRPLERRESRPLPRELGFYIEGFAGAAGA